MRTILVSGAGSGIGRAIVQELDERSSVDSFVLLGRNLKRLKETRESLRDPSRHEIVSVDVTDAAKMRVAFKRLRPALEGLHAVIAGAGIDEAHDGPDEGWHRVIETNLTGTYRLIHEALPSLRGSKRGYRHVVILSSLNARASVPGHAAYCASKAGLLGLMRTLALELAPEKILVNAVCPGPVRAGMATQEIRRLMRRLKVTEESAWWMLGNTAPLQKLCEPREIASLIAYLISDGQISITGQAIDINNGILML